MRGWNWPLIGLFAFLFVATSVGVVSSLEPAFCDAGKLLLAAKQQDVVVFSCTEFWFNRYQALIGSWIAFIVASAALYPVYRQMSFTSKQTAVMAAQALRSRVIEWNAHLNETRTIVAKTRVILDFAFRFDFRDSAIGNNAEFLEKELADFQSLAMRQWEIMVSELESASRQHREQADNTSTTVADSVKALIVELYHIINYIERPNITSRKRVRIEVENIIENCKTYLEQLDNLEMSITSEIVLAWQSIRKFEKNAVTAI